MLRHNFVSLLLLDRGRYTLVSNGLQISLSHITIPALANKIKPKFLVLLSKVLTHEIWHEEICHQNASNTCESLVLVSTME